MSILPGKGIYTWGLKYLCANPNAPTTSEIVNVIMDGGFSHVLVKIADGVGDYNVSVNLPAIVAELQGRGVVVFGWQYIYGNDPVREARKAVERCEYSGVTGYVIDAEQEYKNHPGRAKLFIDTLYDWAIGIPVGLATYRYPSLHGDFPFTQFLVGCQFVMPQVYWQDAHNPVAQLNKSWGEYHQLAPDLPFIPTGAAYGEGDWQVQPDEIDQFLGQAQHLGFEGANFWELGYARKNLPAVYQQIKAYQWGVVVPEPPDPDPGEPMSEQLLTEIRDAVKDNTAAIRNMEFELTVMLQKVIKAIQGQDPGGPAPEPSWKKVQVKHTEKRINAWYIDDYNTKDKPILVMYPYENAPVKDRVQFQGGANAQVLDVDPDKLDANEVNGDSGFWKLAPHMYPDGLPELYVQEFEVVEI